MNNDDINNSSNQNPNNGPVPVNNVPQNPVQPTAPQQQPVINDFMTRPQRPTPPRNPNFENAKTEAQNMGQDLDKLDINTLAGMPQPTVSVHKKSNRRLLTMVFVLLLVVLLAVGGYIYLKSNKKKTTTSSSTTTSMANMVNTWTGKGTSDKFSDGANWSMGVPTNGQKLEINLSNVVAPSTTSATGSSTTAVVASSTPTILNDIASLSVKELKIDGSAKVTSLSITGKTLGLSGDLSINPTSTSGIKVGLNLPITLGADSTFSVGGANDVTVSGDTTSIFALGSYKLNLSVSNTANLNFLMPLSGTGSLIFAANSVSLAANAYFQAVSPSFNGKVEIGNNDVVVLGNSGATGAFGSAAITVNNGGSLELQSTTPTYALSNPLFLSGNGVNNSSANALGATTGALTGCITAGLGKCNPGLVVTLSGLVTLNANTQVGAVFLPSAGAKITGNSVSYHFANLVKNNFTVTTVANSQALIN